MKLQPFRRLIAMVLTLALMATLVYIPGDAAAKAVTIGGVTVQELLGENWYVNYNGGTLSDTEYLSIVPGGSQGDYSLRIGHVSQATNLCLRYDLYKTDIGLAATEALAIGMKFSAKIEGSFADGSWIGVINPVENAGGGNRNNLTEADMASIGTDWTVIDKDDEYYGVWCGEEYDRAVLEFNIVLDAGNYFYLDDLQGYGYWGNTADMAYVNVVHNGSFEPETGAPETTVPETTVPETTVPETTEPEEPGTPWNQVQQKLGENWYVQWNGGAAADGDYLTVTEGGSHGAYSLRIGHATEKTDLCLRYKLYKSDMGLSATDEMGIGMKFSAKVEGSLESGSWIGVINPVEVPAGGNRSNLTDSELASIGAQWTAIDKSAENYGVWCGPEYDRAELEFNIVLEPGSYFYLDDLQGYGFWGSAGDMENVNVVHNGSFERWYCAWNASEATTEASDFAVIVEGGRSGNALRLGNADQATDYTLHLQLPAPQADGYSFDLWAKTQGDVSGASFELFDGSLSGAVRRYSLAEVGADWTHIQHGYDVTDVWVNSGTLLVQLYVNLPAGSFLYLDDLHIIKGLNGVYSADASNMLFDGGFEGDSLGFAPEEIPGEPETTAPETTVPETTEPETTEPETTEPETTVPETTEPETTEPAELASLVSAAKSPADWYVSWNERQQNRSAFLTSQAHSGSYALALTALEADMGHTFAVKTAALEAGAEYVFEGYFKKTGEFSYISIMMESTFLQLKDWQMDEWTLCTGSFTAGTGNTFSIFAACAQGGQLLADDLKLYKASDEEKTNLLPNGGFETTVSSAGEMLKIDKAFTAMPVTVEARLRLPANAQQGGVILGNLSQSGYNVGVNSQGQPYVYAVLPDGTATEAVFDRVDVRTGEALELTVTCANGALKCFVNGEEKQVLAVTVPESADLYAEAFAIGGDNTQANENYFAGDLITLSVSSTEGVIAAWELENASDPEQIPDSTGNGYTALYYGEFFDRLQSAVTEKYPYAFAVVGDTQYTNRGDTQNKIPGADYMGGIYQWIIDNKDVYNIQAVLGMGDIVDTSPSTLDESAMTQSLTEWTHAVESIGKLNAAGIPYTLVKGNHDAISEYPENDASVFENSMKALGYDTQVDGWYAEGGTLANAYLTLTVGQTKWLFITLDYNHSEEEIAWANSVIAAHADHKVIVSTHAYLNANGQWLADSDRCELVGQDLWEMLISQHENIELVLCGHIHSSDVVVRQLKGKGDNIVTEMLIDSQSLDRDAYLASGTAPYAMATLLMFSQDGQEVMVANYSTGKDKFYHADAIKTLDMSDGQDIEAPVIAEPMEVPLEDKEIPGWVTRWNGNEGVNYRYLTTYAHSGSYALALTGTESAISYTYGQLLRKLEIGKEYTFEGYVLHSGKFSMLDLMFAGNANKQSLRDLPAEQWNKVTMTFVAEDTTVPMELFGDGKAKAIVLLDDVTVYKTEDAQKTNLVENPGFEVIEQPQTAAPEKTYDYPTGWDIWAENDDSSQLFVTDTARQGSNGFAFVNTAKHASSLTQYVTGLESGSYVLSAYVRSSGGQEDAALLAKGYDKENPEGQSGAKITQCGIWTRIELEFQVTSGQVQVSLWNAGNAGNWIAVDQVELLAKNDTTYTNLLKNGSFEEAENGEPPAPTEPPAVPTEPAGPTEPTEPPMKVALIDSEIPGWVTRWNGNEGVNYRYLTTHAHSGSYALALTGTESAISYTYGQLLRKLEIGKEYTFEGYVLYSGHFGQLDLLISGTANRLSLKEVPAEQWTKVTLSFVAEDSTVPVEIFCDAPAGAIVLLDDVTVYKTGDAQKTNLVENPGFEVIEQPQTAAPEKSYDYPIGWDIWAENDDSSQLFVTDTARQGSNGFAFVNTAKHASSLTQYVTGLESGSYVLSAYIRSSGGQEDAALLAKGYDKENPEGQSGAKITQCGIWTRIELEFQVTSGQVQVSLWNAGNAGNWIAVDQVELLAKNDTTYTNLLKNGSFEEAENGEPPAPTEPPTEPIGPTEPPMEVPLEDKEIPGWVTRWNGNEGVNYRYLTTHAHSGSYALALTGTESAISYTYGQLLRKLEIGKEYTFEGYVLYSGHFGQLDLLISGTANRLSLKEVPAEQWTKVTLSFVAEDSTVPVEIFCDAPAGAIVLLDDVTVYKTEDTQKTNLVENPGFEVIEQPQTAAPEKSYDYPIGWDIWAENDDSSQLFVTDTARQGSNGFAFVNTAKHASSLTQYVTGLESGSYVLSAYVRSSGGQEDAALLAKGYDKENPEGQSGAKITQCGIWTRIELEFQVTSGQVQVSLWNAGNAGNWIAVDQVELLAKNDTAYTNLLKNGSFEEAENGEPPAPTEPPTEPIGPTEPPMEVPLEDKEIPGWVTRWNGNEGVNYRYLTTHAHSGSYALALTGTESAISYTYGQLLRKLETGKEYTFEGYVLYSGHFGQLDLLISGTANRLSLKEVPAEQWTKVTLSFVAEDSTVPVEVFCDAPAGAIVLLDDVTVYKTGDTQKTNLVENPGFEVIEQPQTAAPEKSYDYPIGWDIWAENDDSSQLFVTDTARQGSNGFAFVNTAKHASSLTQYVTGLESGSYVLSAYVRSSGGQEDAALLAKGYDKENPEGQSGAKITQCGIWTRIELEFQVTSGQVQVSLWNAGNAGNWIAVDQVELLAKNDTTYTNLLKNGSFEEAENELPPQTPIQVELIDRDIPGWVEAWNQNPGTNYRYLTTHAHSGSYALALVSKSGTISYTFAQRLELQVGVSYTLEGYAYKSGELDAADILIGPNGADGKISLAEKRMDGYEKITVTFRPSSDYLEIGAYVSGPQDSLLLLDDLKLYRTGDSQDLLTNGDFETVEKVQTEPPVKVEDFPLGWEIWAEDDDLSLVYVAAGGRNGYAIGIHNTKKQAASLTQTVTGLEDGTYVLTAWVRSSGGQNDVAMLLKGYDRENPAGQAGVQIPKTGIWVQLRLEVEVTSGQVLVSFWSDANEGNWLMIDEVSLYRKGDEAKTNLLTNGGFEEVLKVSGGELPPAGELTETQPQPATQPDETPTPEKPDGMAWLGFVLGTVLILGVLAAAAIVLISKKRKK